MPLRTKTYDIESELEDLRSEREEVAEQVADADPDSNATQQLVQEGQRKDRYISGLEWYREEYDADEIELGALTNGERHRVRDTANQIGETDAARQNAYVAHGVTAAPFVDHDPQGIVQEEYKTTIGNIADMHPALVDWLEQRITKLGRMDGDTGKSFETLVQEKRTQAISEATNG